MYVFVPISVLFLETPRSEPNPIRFYGADAKGYTDYPPLRAVAASRTRASSALMAFPRASDECKQLPLWLDSD
jgi:hypothetical protein